MSESSVISAEHVDCKSCKFVNVKKQVFLPVLIMGALKYPCSVVQYKYVHCNQGLPANEKIYLKGECAGLFLKQEVILLLSFL